jgi:hypothetical protein
MLHRCKNIPKHLIHFSQLKKYTNASHNQLFTFQSRKMMELLIPRIQSAPKSQDLDSLWKICELMMKNYTRQDWNSLEEYMWKDLLESVGKMDNGLKKQGFLVEFRKKASTTDSNSIFVSPNLSISSLDQAKGWVQSLHEEAITSLEDDTLNQTLLSAFKSMSIVEFLKVCTLFETELHVDTKPFVDYQLNLYKSKKKIPFSWSEDDESLYLSLLSKPNSIIQDISSLIPDRDLCRKKMLLLLEYRYESNVWFWNLLAGVVLIRKYKDIQQFIQAMERRKIIPNIRTYITIMEHLSPLEMRKLLNDVQGRHLPSGQLLLEYCRNCLNKEATADALNVYSFHSDKRTFFQDYSAGYVYQNLLLHACYERNTTAVIQLIHDAKENGFEVPQDVASSSIVTLCKSGLPELAQVLFDEHRTCHDSYSHDDIFAISNAYIVMKKYTAALQFVRTVIQRHGVIGKRTRHVVLKGLLESGNVEEAEKWVLECLKHKDLEMIELISSYFVSNNSLDKSSKWINIAKRNGFPSTSKLDVNLVKVMIKEGKMATAMEVIKELESTSEVMDEGIYATFLEEFILSASWTQFESLWSGLCNKGLHDSWTVQYIRYLTLTDRLELINDLIPKLQIETNPRTFQQLILVLLRTNQVERAVHVLQEFRKVGPTIEHAYAVSYFVSHFAR